MVEVNGYGRGLSASGLMWWWSECSGPLNWCSCEMRYGIDADLHGVLGINRGGKVQARYVMYDSRVYV